MAHPSDYGTQIPVPLGSTLYAPPANFGFYEYLPSRYAGTPDKKWPLIVFCEGSGETGNGAANLPRMLTTGLPHVIKNGKFPSHAEFIVLSIQYNGYPTAAKLDAFVDWATLRYRIDPARVYLTGLSMGAITAYKYAMTRGDAGKFAAYVTISGNNALTDGCKMKRRPVWIFHGAADTNTNTKPQHSIDTQARINACAPMVRARLTLFPGSGHAPATWNAVYDLSKLNGAYVTTYDPYDKSVFDWMLQYHL